MCERTLWRVQKAQVSHLSVFSQPLCLCSSLVCSRESGYVCVRERNCVYVCFFLCEGEKDTEKRQRETETKTDLVVLMCLQNRLVPLFTYLQGKAVL